ncbi:MAG: PEP-CTERM sorting domain-containing protein [Alphaproteobacteria bacterium]|nr:PEP-CTERM sorting domain-containing protein [Alphaproteobacteria bacterium]
MLAFSRRLALALAVCAALFPALGILSAHPATAATCNAITSGSAVTSSISDCSEILTITQSGGNFNVSVSYPSNGSSLTNHGFNNNGVLLGVVNNTGVAIQDLMLIGYTGMPIFNIVPSETLCFTNLAPGNCNIGSTATAPHNLVTYTITGNEGKILGNGNLVYFTNIGVGNSTANNQGDIVFDGGLPAGFTAEFALTNLAQSVCVTNGAGQCIPSVNEPASLFLFGSGLLAIVALRRRWIVPPSRRRWNRWR